MTVSEDYNKFVLEPFDFCAEPCDMFGLKLVEISVREVFCNFILECSWCGETTFRKLTHEDLIFHSKQFLIGKPVGIDFRLFRLGLFYPDLIDKYTKKNYLNLFMKILNELRGKTIFNDGKKIRIPKKLGNILEHEIKKQQIKL